VRVYLPATTSSLRELLDCGELRPAPFTGFAVTPGLREWYLDEDGESLEYAALIEAARASLRLLDADAAASRRRVVVVADLDDRAVTVRDDLDRGVVQVTADVAIRQVAAVHADDPDAEQAIARAASAVLAADLGDRAAQDTVDDAEGFELGWYASQEIGTVLGTG
jgi:hypothetical protein